MSIRRLKCPKCGSVNIDTVRVIEPTDRLGRQKQSLECKDCLHTFESMVLVEHKRGIRY